ncbi:MAG: MFS transporter [Clostridia bacterium]|nr:MFS transporter [Clostridia bacterium]
MTKSQSRVKLACYISNIGGAVIGNLPPLLFLTFRELYGISFSLLGTLVLINFFTQLIIDLIFSFFSHKFNIPATVRMMPVLTFVGLAIFALTPWLLPNAIYGGLVLGTVIFSISSGLGEVLISPIIAALPSKDPDRAMSALHSIYAWGVVGVVILSTIYLKLVGNEHWQWLVFAYMLIPTVTATLYFTSEIPGMETPGRVSGVLEHMKNPTLWLCFFCIFLGGAAECTMAQWASGYLEAALGIPKLWGDVFGVAMFGLALGTGRTLYAKRGKNIANALFFGAIGAAVCYFVAAVVNVPLIGLIACAFTGFCVSMLWPGSLIVGERKFPSGGVFIFAMMAAGGDMGASVGPQLIGIITDAAIAIPAISEAAASMGLAPEQLGMKLGMLVGMLFPLLAIPLYARVRRQLKK